MKPWSHFLCGSLFGAGLALSGAGLLLGYDSSQDKMEELAASVEEVAARTAAAQVRNHLRMLAHLESQDISAARRFSNELLLPAEAALMRYTPVRSDAATRRFVEEARQQVEQYRRASAGSSL